MTALPIHAVWLDKDTRAALKEWAWLNRSSAAAAVRAALQDIIDNAADVSVLSDTDAPSTIHLNVKAEMEFWDAAVAAASAVGPSFNSLVRRRIRKMLQEEGLLP